MGFPLEDMDMSGFQKGAVYGQIKAYVLEKYHIKVSSLYIPQIRAEIDSQPEYFYLMDSGQKKLYTAKCLDIKHSKSDKIKSPEPNYTPDFNRLFGSVFSHFCGRFLRVNKLR